MRYFNEIVGLRFFLAAWVAIGHALQLSGVLTPTNIITKILLDGHAAVAIFMIISGFVITNLIIGKREAYAPYIVRRFFRLFPAYAIACVFGTAIMGMWLFVVTAAPWSSIDGWANYATAIREMHEEIQLRFAPHFLAHLTMMHGIIPAELLNRASSTFLPAAWSISLEWQFYLIAPLIIGSFVSWRRISGVAFVAIILLVLTRRGVLGTYQLDSAVFGASIYFSIGIVSRLLADKLASLDVNPIAAMMIGLFFTLSLNQPLPIAVWVIFYSMMIWKHHAGFLGRAFSLATTSKIPMLLGESSFSLYLLHRPFQVLFAYLTLVYLSSTAEAVFAAQMIGTVVAIPVSILSYNIIERPGSALGSRFAKMLSKKVDGRASETPATSVPR